MSLVSTRRENDSPLAASPCETQPNGKTESILQETLKACLMPGSFNEIYAARETDTVAATGFTLASLGLTRKITGFEATPLLWIRQAMAMGENGAVYPPGLPAFGIHPGDVIALCVRDMRSALQAGLDGARSSHLDVLIEVRGENPIYDLTASRRLALAAAASKARIILQRSAAAPIASAARTRWSIRAAPSLPTEIKAPGDPAFDATLLHHRGGQGGFQAIVEWNNETRSFVERDRTSQPYDAALGAKKQGSPDIAPVSRTVVPLFRHGSRANERRKTAGSQ